jgi:DNA polymerase III gamma/tau subunit
MVASLEKVVEGEKIKVELGVLDAIARSVDGSFRDGMKLLEQLGQQTDKAINIQEALSAAGLGQEYDADILLQALLKKDVTLAMVEVDEREKSGADLLVYIKRLLELIRIRLIEAVEEKRDEVSELVLLADVVDAAAVKMKTSVLPQLVMMAMVAGWCTKETKNSEVKVKQAEIKMVEKSVKPVKLNQKPDQQVVVVAKDLFAGKLEEVRDKWQQILAAVKPLNHSLEALLRSARPKSVDNGVLQIEAFYKFHKEQLEQEKHRQKLEEAMGSVLGGKILLEIILGEQQAVKLERVEDEALVKAAEEIFG